MVAKITTPQTIRRALNYNEQKVKQEKATCIHAGNYLKDAHEMNFHEKLARFQQQIELSKAKTNTLHISLNFDPADNVDTEKMVSIANAYMQKIGFGNQPYLVYQHHDAGHPHCHIVTTNIKEDGKRIDTYNIGKKWSEPARKALESEYGLIKAEGRQQQKATEPAQRVEYGKSESKRSITNVLDTVLDQYKYASLAELNAVLRLYNVEADRGKEGSRTYEKRGLHYRIIDPQGHKIGVPIKASSIYSKPTLANLEKRFEANALLKSTYKTSLKVTIDWVLNQKPESLREWIDQLQKEGVSVVLRQSEKGQVYGITYVDHNTRTVFNGSDLGKSYSAKGVLQQLQFPMHKEREKSFEKTRHPEHQQRQDKEPRPPKTPDRSVNREKDLPFQTGRSATFSLVENLLHPESGKPLNAELREEERRRRRKSLDHDQEHEM